MRAFHQTWAYATVIVTAAVGVWGVSMAALRRAPGRSFAIGTGAAVVVALVQVVSGVATTSQGLEADGFHTFYGVLIAVSFAFAYVYRSQFARRPALSYGLLLLFVMGLALRAWGF